VVVSEAGRTLWGEIAKQVPALAVLAFLVFTFLHHLEKRDAMLHELSENSRLLQVDTRAALHENTMALGKVVEALRQVESLRDSKRGG